VLRWTAIPLIVLMWLMVLTGPGTFKGAQLEKVTFGILRVDGAGKWHSVWLPPITAVVFFVHTTMGLEMIVQRTAWLKPKGAWEIGMLVLGALGLAQFVWLYYG
jgi:hypothetical protein